MENLASKITPLSPKEVVVQLIPVPQDILVYDVGADYYDRILVVYPDGAVFSTPLNEDPYFKYNGPYAKISTDGAKSLKLLPRYVLDRIEKGRV